MPELQQTIAVKLKELDSKEAKKRRDAAYFLGNVAAEQAITKLVQVYKNDKNKSVRAAAAYALGQFRALEALLEQGDQEKVSQLADRIEQGKLGRRLPIPPSVLAKFNLVLLVIFIGLALGNGVLLFPKLGIDLSALGGGGTPGGGTDVSQAARKDRNTLLAEIHAAYTALNNDGETLQRQFQNLMGGSAMDCQAFFNNPAPIEIASADAQANPDLAKAVQTLNTAQEKLTAAKLRFDQHCFDDMPIPPDQIGAVLAPVLEALRTLPEVEGVLSGSPTTATAQPTLEPTPTETVTPAPTVQPADPRTHMVALYGIIDDMISPRGGNGLLKRYWEDAVQAGRTAGCNDVVTIPGNYVLPDAEAQAVPQLKQAADLVNTGLELTRQGWQLFREACSNNTLNAQASLGLQTATAADQAYQSASGLLDAVRNEA